jgi:mannose-6-phosphate isomerase-like protein (cupin superfamily)
MPARWDSARRHRHAYGEIFIIQAGRATYRLGPDTLDVAAPRVLIIPTGTAHGYVNSGPGPYRHIAIHLNARFSREWPEGLTDDARAAVTDALWGVDTAPILCQTPPRGSI